MKKSALILTLLMSTSAFAQEAALPAPVENQITDSVTTPVNPQITDAVTQLEKQVTDLNTQINILRTDVNDLKDDTTTSQLANNIATLENTVSIIENNPTWATIAQQVNELEKMVAELTELNAAQHSNILTELYGYIDKHDAVYNASIDEINTRIKSILSDIDVLQQQHTTLIDRVDLEDATIKFEFNSDVIDEQGMAVVNAMVAFMKAHDSYGLVVSGYADVRGSKTYNMHLAQSRADAVRAEIVSQGISEDRVVAISFGETVLANPADHDWNRRVRFDLRK